MAACTDDELDEGPNKSRASSSPSSNKSMPSSTESERRTATGAIRAAGGGISVESDGSRVNGPASVSSMGSESYAPGSGSCVCSDRKSAADMALRCCVATKGRERRRAAMAAVPTAKVVRGTVPSGPDTALPMSSKEDDAESPCGNGCMESDGPLRRSNPRLSAGGAQSNADSGACARSPSVAASPSRGTEARCSTSARARAIPEGLRPALLPGLLPGKCSAAWGGTGDASEAGNVSNRAAGEADADRSEGAGDGVGGAASAGKSRGAVDVGPWTTPSLRSRYALMGDGGAVSELPRKPDMVPDGGA